MSTFQLKGVFVPDVVIGEGATTVYEVVSAEDEILFVDRDSFLFLDLRLHVVNGVGRFHEQGGGLAGVGLHEYLHVLSFGNNKN